jgi:hypothetical protein
VAPARQWRLLVRGRATTPAGGPALIRLYDASAPPLLAIPIAAAVRDARDTGVTVTPKR